jgi:hypothetical protein
MKSSLYHIAQILEKKNLPVPATNILFPLGRHIKNEYKKVKGELPPRADFNQNGEYFTAFAYPESEFDFILQKSSEFMDNLNKSSLDLDF